MALEINGKLIQKLELQSGMSKSGSNWQKQEFIIYLLEVLQMLTVYINQQPKTGTYSRYEDEDPIIADKFRHALPPLPKPAHSSFLPSDT